MLSKLSSLGWTSLPTFQSFIMAHTSPYLSVPFRDTKQLNLAAIRLPQYRHSQDLVQKPHQGPPLDLFECGREHPQRGLHHPPEPFLARFNIIDGSADVLDRFFGWYSHFPTEHNRKMKELALRPVHVIEIVRLVTGSDLGKDNRSKERPGGGRFIGVIGKSMEEQSDKYQTYFIEDSDFHGSFESIPKTMGMRLRAHHLPLLNSTLLKCKEHGNCWEVNVFGQNEKKEVEIKAESEAETDVDNDHEIHNIKDKIHKIQKRLKKLEVKIDKPKEEDWKEGEKMEGGTKEEEKKAEGTKEKALMKDSYANVAK